MPMPRPLVATALATLTLASMIALPVGGQDLRGRDDVLARAPLGMRADSIGRYYDSEFRPLVGGSQSIPYDDDDVIATDVGYTRRDFRVVESADELRANASAWGVSGSISASDATRHAYYRAYTIDRMSALSDSVALPEVVPARAAYYVSAVFVGRLFEAHFHSRSTTGSIAVAASDLVASGGIEAWASENNLEVQIDALGFESVDDTASFAESQSEVTRRYRPSGDPRAVFVRFSRIPSSLRAMAPGESGRYSIRIDRIVFPTVRPGVGARWDAFGGDPDITVEVRLDGSLVYTPTRSGSDSLVRDFTAERTVAGADRVGVMDPATITSASSLTFHFIDVDTTVATSDDGGTLTITGAEIAAVEGSQTFTSAEGVRLTLTVTRTE